MSPGHRRGRSLYRIGRALRTLLLNGVARPLSGLWPRRARWWAFGHQGGTFAGNSKFLFLWVVRNRPDIRAVWITGSIDTRDILRAHGLPVYLRWSPPGMWYALRAKVYLFCHSTEDVNLPLSRGALLVNLWHGVGLKAVHLGDPNSLHSKYGRGSHSWLVRVMHLAHRLRPDVLVTTSAFTRDHFSAQLELPPEHCPSLGYPRLDARQDADLAKDARALEPLGLARLKPDGIDEIYAYLPTFRDTGRDFLRRALPDLPALDAVLLERNALLYLKLHRHTADRLPALGERILMWPAAADFYAHLDELSGLITDYSSVYYDYIHGLSTGAILYAFDEDEYTVSDRSLLYSYRNNTVGARAATFDDLLRILRNGEAFIQQVGLAEIRSKFWGDASGTACARVTRYLERRLALKVSNCDVTRLSSSS